MVIEEITSEDQAIFAIICDEALKVFALSAITVVSNPL